jgi:predicted CoA-binding protein
MMHYSDAFLRQIFNTTKTIALVGASANPARPSHYVGQFLTKRGWRVIGVNPGLAGQSLYGETVYASLSDIPEPVDMVDIFRRSEDVPPVVDEALSLPHKPAHIWMQIGVVHDGAAAKAEVQGLSVVMNRCPMVEVPRLFGPGVAV